MDVGERKRAGGSGTGGFSDETLACVLKYVESAQDRAAASRVCQQWRRVDGATRRFVTVAYMYSTCPEMLTRRFSRLKGVKIKGKPRAAEYDLLVPHWGGYATPWIRELGRAYAGLQTLQLRRCQVSDADLALVASAPFHAVLQVLHLHKCAGFSTSGLLPVSQSCRSLKTLSVEDSDVADEGGAWLHALAVHNSGALEVLNFAVLGVEDVDMVDLALLVEKCKSLVSLKVGEMEMVDMVGAISRAGSLRELGTGSCSYLGDEDSRSYVPLSLSPDLTALSGMWAMGDSGLPMILPLAPNLKKLDLKFTLLSRKAYCQLFSLCHALEELQIRNGVGDEGMEVLGRTCKGLRRLRVEHDDAGSITQRGVVAVAQGCRQLQQLVLYVSDITNAALAMVGHGCEHLTDFRLVLEPTANRIVDLPLDDGIKLLLRGCRNLSKMAVYLRHGGLTDRGMGYIGEYGHNLKWLLLGCTGESDVGLVNLSYKAQRLQRLEIRDCPFGEAGLAAAVVSMSSLKFLWMQGYRAVEAGQHLLALCRPYLNLEIGLPSGTQPGQLIAHYSTVGLRSDYPLDVRVLVPNLGDEEENFLLHQEHYSSGSTDG